MHEKQSNTTRVSATLRALRMNSRELLGIGTLFLVTILTWCAAEFSTVTFHDRIENELRTVTASDISASTQTFPDEATRAKLREIGAQFGARRSESVEFPLTINVGGSGSTARYATTEIQIVDGNYPLYGEVTLSGSFADGAIVESSLYDMLPGRKIQVGNVSVPVTGTFSQAPGVSQNPFAMNGDAIIPASTLPFDAVTSSGSGYRIRYSMDFATSADQQKPLLEALRATFSNTGSTSFRIREERGEGGNFSEIANTLNDFLGTILYASALIALSSFIVAFSRFALERRKTVRTLIWMGLPESALARRLFSRLFMLFGIIGTVALLVLAFLPGISTALVAKGGFFLAIAMGIAFWIATETLLQNTRILERNQKRLRIGIPLLLVALLVGYLGVSLESVRPLAYALGAIIALERLSWAFFHLASIAFSRTNRFSKSRFFLLDALRSFRDAPVLGKVSFSVFFLLSATLAAVFLFSLAFRDTLRTTTESRINTFAVNLLPSDYEKLSSWMLREDFYSTLRARIVTINDRTLAEHLNTPEVSREFTREFSVTDGETGNAILAGRAAKSEREVSIDSDFSERLGVFPGDRLRFAIAGREFDFTITGIRESVRNGTTPFFYFQIPENAIAGAPKTYFLATEVTGNADTWKTRVIGETGSHVSFVDVGKILEQVRSYSQLVLQGVLALFAYIAAIGLLAFLTAEKSFFLLKIRKVQLYRLLGATE